MALQNFSNPLFRKLLVAAQVLYVLGVAGAGYATTTLGQRVTLAAAPINPQELNTGDFVRLRYGIGEVPRSLWHDAAPPSRRQSVYILLSVSHPDSIATVAGVSAAAPAAGPGQAVLRGWVAATYTRSLALRFGLERYYVPDASPLRRERVGRAHPLRVQVSIAPWGQASITQVQLRR